MVYSSNSDLLICYIYVKNVSISFLYFDPNSRLPYCQPTRHEDPSPPHPARPPFLLCRLLGYSRTVNPHFLRVISSFIRCSISTRIRANLFLADVSLSVFQSVSPSVLLSVSPSVRQSVSAAFHSFPDLFFLSPLLYSLNSSHVTGISRAKWWVC